jgi:hypothetical protein
MSFTLGEYAVFEVYFWACIFCDRQGSLDSPAPLAPACPGGIPAKGEDGIFLGRRKIEPAYCLKLLCGTQRFSGVIWPFNIKSLRCFPDNADLFGCLGIIKDMCRSVNT